MFPAGMLFRSGPWGSLVRTEAGVLPLWRGLGSVLLRTGAATVAGVLEMVSKAGHLTSEAQPQRGVKEGDWLGSCHPAQELFSLFTTGNTGLSKVYGSIVKILRCLLLVQ